MSVTRRLAVASGVALALCALATVPSWSQQSALRSQTDEVQRAISEALREATAGQRRNAAQAELQRRALESSPAGTPERESSPGGSNAPAVPPIPGGARH